MNNASAVVGVITDNNPTQIVNENRNGFFKECIFRPMYFGHAREAFTITIDRKKALRNFNDISW